MSGNTPNNFGFEYSFTGTYLRINALTTYNGWYNSQTPQLCSSSPTLCPDAGLPGTTCTDRSTSLGVWCNVSIAYPYISSITSSDCTNDNNNDYHLNKCPTATSITITINGLYFDQTGSTTKTVRIGNTICTLTSWTDTKIICNLPAGDSNNLVVNVTALNGISNTQTQPKLLSFTPPVITSIAPNPSTSQGGVTTTFTGTNFGTTTSTITININNVACTGVTWISNTEVRATTPAGSGGNHPVVINVGGQDSTSAPTFSYKDPVITSVAPTLGGGDLVLSGADFANAAITIEITDTQTNQVTTCPTPVRNSYTEVKCTFTEAGAAGTCLQKNVTVTISSLVSNTMRICYLAEGDLNLPTAQQIVEGSTYTYTLTLTDAPQSQNVAVAIASSSFNCVVSPTSTTFTASNYNTGFEVTISVADNDVDEGTNANAFTCTLTHTVTSSDIIYANTNAKSFTITAVNNDNADAKLQLIAAGGGFEYKLKVVGPLAITEGTDTSYGLVLDTEPTQNVMVYPAVTSPRSNTPLSVTLSPSQVVFTPSNWNTPQQITLSASGDDIDNDVDEETFEVLYYISTSDSIFQSKATNNTVIARISDDDTAGISLENNGVVQLTEGGASQTFSIVGLTSEPLESVDISLSATSNLVQISPSTFTISASNWNNVNKVISLQALNGNYAGGTTFSISIQATSIDAKYEDQSVIKTAVVTTNDAAAGFSGLPAEGFVSEGGVFQYKFGLTTPPQSKDVNVKIESLNTNCKVPVATQTFTTANWMTQQIVRIEVNIDGKFLAKESTSYQCNIRHTVDTQDSIYQSIAAETILLSVTSTGCGLGEFLGAYQRKDNGTQCICSQNYFLPLNSDCVTCPTEKSACVSLGLTAPPVAKNWWRYDPTSSNLELYKFYNCPFPGTCLGGNSSIGRCVKGHDDKGVVCATCSPEYVLQGQQCISCPGRKDAAIFSTELLALCMAGLVLFSLATFTFLTQQALTKKDIELLKVELDPSKLGKTLNRKEFVQTFEKRTSLTASQLDQAFGLVDTNKDGSIDLEEILSFTNASTSGVELGTVLDEGLSSIEKVSEKINKEASPEVFDIWNKHSMLLNAIEKWIKDMKGAIQRAKKSTEEFLKQFQSKLNGAYDENDKSEWLDTLLENIEKILMEPIEQLEAYVEKVEAILYRMKHVFAEHLHDMKMLLQNLKGLYLELNLLLGTFPSLNLNFDLVWTRVLATLFSFNIDLSKLETLVKKLLSDANALFIDIRTDIAAVLKQLEAMLQFLMNIQWKIGANMLDVGGWLMKVKIFIGFAQCYAYFPVTFDIPWPKNLLAFMKAMEFTAFDFYEVFGNVSCRMQTGFLQKYVYHMALFPAILAIILAMYVVARFLCINRLNHIAQMTIPRKTCAIDSSPIIINPPVNNSRRNRSKIS